jgi:hypothetical protein
MTTTPPRESWRGREVLCCALRQDTGNGRTEGREKVVETRRGKIDEMNKELKKGKSERIEMKNNRITERRLKKTKLNSMV